MILLTLPVNKWSSESDLGHNINVWFETESSAAKTKICKEHEYLTSIHKSWCTITKYTPKTCSSLLYRAISLHLFLAQTHLGQRHLVQSISAYHNWSRFSLANLTLGFDTLNPLFLDQISLWPFTLWTITLWSFSLWPISFFLCHFGPSHLGPNSALFGPSHLG